MKPCTMDIKRTTKSQNKKKENEITVYVTQ